MAFAQFIRALAADPEGLRRHWRRWHDELAAGAHGWLDSTAGLTGAGELVALVRFADAEAARANAARPEQDAWWADLLRSLDHEPTRSWTATTSVRSTASRRSTPGSCR
jgi:hypothetical protein